MVANNIQQDVYEVLLNTKKTIQEMGDHIKQVLEEIKRIDVELLASLYQRNEVNKELGIKAAMSLPSAENVKDVLPLANSPANILDKITGKLNKTNQELGKIENTLSLLQGSDRNEYQAKKLNKRLENLNELNKAYQALNELAHKQAMLLGNSKDVKVEGVNEKLGELYKEVKILKEQVKVESKKLDKQQNIEPKPSTSKRSFRR